MSDNDAKSPSIADKLARLEQLEECFQQALEAEKLESMAEFAAGAGHEINNPLTVISGRAQLLLRDETDPERRHALALISAQAMRVYEMIADMMLFARPPRPEPRQVDLIELIDAVVADFQPRADRQNTKIFRTSGQAPVHVEADPVQLNVALHAVCQNSIEALGSGGSIEIALEATPDDAAIRITDDGPGFKPEERRHAFDPFYSARQAGRGLGFGLSKAWRIVTNHGGNIKIENQNDRGAVIVISLPTNHRDMKRNGENLSLIPSSSDRIDRDSSSDHCTS